VGTVRHTAGRGGILALALLFAIGALAVATEGPSAAVHRVVATVDRLGPRTPVVSARSPRARMAPSGIATASLAAGVALLGVALGLALGGRNRSWPRAASRSRAPPLPRFG